MCFFPAHLVNLHVLNYSGFLSVRAGCSLEFAVDVNKSRSYIINLHRVSLSRPTVPIQCTFSFIMFIAFRFKSLYQLYISTVCKLVFLLFLVSSNLSSIECLKTVAASGQEGFAFGSYIV